MGECARLITEADLLAAITGAAHRRDLLVYHGRPAPGGFDSGFPDLVIAGPGGLLLAEVKTARGRLTVSQWAWAGMLITGGAQHRVWRPADWPDPILEQLDSLAAP